MFHVLVTSLPLVAGLGLALLAARRGWAPPLAVAILVGAALRLAIMVIAAQDSWQPWDLVQDFRSTADTVRDGREPVAYLREGGWHFLPFMAYVLAAERELGLLLGIPWEIVGRLGPILADLALIPIVGRLANRDGALRGFQYACAPLGIMVSALHGQFAPFTLLLGLGALLAARHRRGSFTGLLAGLSVTSTSWSVLLVPGILRSLPGTRRRLVMLGWTAVVPVAFLVSSTMFLDTPFARLPHLATEIMSTRPVVGDWGWTAVATGGELDVSPGLARVGTPLLALGVLAALWWWRRADPFDLTLALLLVFLVVTYRFGSQYLAWAAPFLIARPTRFCWPAITVASLWAGTGYLYLTRLDEAGWWQAHTWWSLSSVAVIPFLVAVLPWHRRQAAAADEDHGARPPAAAGRSGQQEAQGVVDLEGREGEEPGGDPAGGQAHRPHDRVLVRRRAEQRLHAGDDPGVGEAE